MRALLPFLASCVLAAQGAASLPWDQIPATYRREAEDVVRRADFVFQTRTEPKHVRLGTMEKLFEHPLMASAMWRHCQFVPAFYAFVHPEGGLETWSIDDARGLHGTLHLLYKRPGHRIYLVEGRAEAGRLKTPFAVGAKMLTSYRYWEGKNGFESHLETWTALDSAVLGVMARPFHGYIRRRQDEFIAYINGNIATFGEFAELNPEEFRGPIQRDGDRLALKDFDQLFRKR